METTVSELQEVLNDVIEMNPCSGMCKDCDYWEMSMFPLYPGDWGYCKMADTNVKDELENPSSLCKATANSWKDETDEEEILEESHWANLQTSPYFGCVQFQKRTA